MANDPYTDGRPLRERVQLYENLPPGIGSLLDLATVLLNRAFVSFRTGNLAVCDAFLNEGLYACGGLFEAKVAHLAENPAHLEDRDWAAFAVHAAGVVPSPQKPRPAPPPPPPAAAAETEAEFRERLHRLAQGDESAKRAPGR